MSFGACASCLPTPLTLASGSESDLPASPSICAVTPVVYVHKYWGENVVCMWVQLVFRFSPIYFLCSSSEKGYTSVTWCCCLPTPMILVCEGSPIIQLLVHQPTYLSIWPAAPSLQRGLSTVWCVCGCS